jgi:K+-sensing histidine kinase KdpD
MRMAKQRCNPEQHTSSEAQVIRIQGTDLEEIDLNAVVVCRSQIALVDELPHTSAPGGRHPNCSSTTCDLAGELSEQEGYDFMSTVIDETERLNRFIAYLLDMAKLGSGAVGCVRKDNDVRAGAGLRLASCYGFVEPMHGTISAVNRIDQSGAGLSTGLPILAAVDTLETAA